MSAGQVYILIGDDDEEDIEILEESLLETDPRIKFSIAKTGKEVIELLDGKQPNDLPSMIILDYDMPELRGPDVLSIICKDHRYKNIPVVCLSTSAFPQHIAECKNKGAADYLTKPKTVQELNTIAQRLIAYVVK